LGLTGGSLSDNHAYNNGGGLFNRTGGSVSVGATTFLSNTATQGSGGGIDNDTGGTVSASATTFTANSAGSYGGGLFNQTGGTACVRGNTFMRNAASVTGGGISNRGSLTPQPAQKYNTFSNNTPNAVGLGALSKPKAPRPRRLPSLRHVATRARATIQSLAQRLAAPLGSRGVDRP
jgi:predicted outer membrane repeat protein